MPHRVYISKCVFVCVRVCVKCTYIYTKYVRMCYFTQFTPLDYMGTRHMCKTHLPRDPVRFSNKYKLHFCQSFQR